MKELVVVSGKGGTGKTSVVAALATLVDGKVMADCDVDAANLHLILDPRSRRKEAFSGSKRARIAPAACAACGKCMEHCRFGAVHVDEKEAEKRYWIDLLACEGCGVCAWVCPTGAIVFEPAVDGHWFVSDTRYGILVHARLGPAAENSGKLVTLLRREARNQAEEQDLGLILVDGSPGIGCQVISSVTGADLLLIVTEPTLSGLHDFGRIADLAGHFSVPAALCINKWDLNPELTGRLEQEACERRIRLVGRLPYSPAFTRAQRRGRTVVEDDEEGKLTEEFETLWENLRPLLAEEDISQRRKR